MDLRLQTDKCSLQSMNHKLLLQQVIYVLIKSWLVDQQPFYLIITVLQLQWPFGLRKSNSVGDLETWGVFSPCEDQGESVHLSVLVFFMTLPAPRPVEAAKGYLELFCSVGSISPINIIIIPPSQSREVERTESCFKPTEEMSQQWLNNTHK